MHPPSLFSTEGWGDRQTLEPQGADGAWVRNEVSPTGHGQMADLGKHTRRSMSTLDPSSINLLKSSRNRILNTLWVSTQQQPHVTVRAEVLNKQHSVCHTCGVSTQSLNGNELIRGGKEEGRRREWKEMNL